MTILIFIAVSAHASEDFSGWAVNGNIGVKLDTTETQAVYDYANLFAGGADGWDNQRIQSSGVDVKELLSGSVGGSYAFWLHDRLLMSVGADCFLDGQKHINSGTYGFSNPNNRADFPRAYSVETLIEPDSRWSVNLRPGTRLFGREDALVYGSVAYHEMQAGIRATTQIDPSNINGSAVFTDVKDREDVSGYRAGGRTEGKVE